MKTEFDDVKELIDNLVINTAINTIKQQVLISMVLGVYRKLLPTENATAVAQNFCDALEQSLLSGLPELKDGMFDDSILDRRLKAVPEEIRKMRSFFLE